MNNFRKQQGVALVVSLVILVSLTMLGLTSIQRTTTDLAMAGNQREIGLMFQSAEIGLHAAEDYIDINNSTADYDNTTLGLYTVQDSNTGYGGPNYFDKSQWENNSSPAGTSLVSDLKLKEEPRFMIEYLGDRRQNPQTAGAIGGYGTQQPGDIVSIYRSTARGAGLTGNSFRYVQSYYGKKIN